MSSLGTRRGQRKRGAGLGSALDDGRKHRCGSDRGGRLCRALLVVVVVVVGQAIIIQGNGFASQGSNFSLRCRRRHGLRVGTEKVHVRVTDPKIQGVLESRLARADDVGLGVEPIAHTALHHARGGVLSRDPRPCPVGDKLRHSLVLQAPGAIHPHPFGSQEAVRVQRLVHRALVKHPKIRHEDLAVCLWQEKDRMLVTDVDRTQPCINVTRHLADARTHPVGGTANRALPGTEKAVHNHLFQSPRVHGESTVHQKGVLYPLMSR